MGWLHKQGRARPRDGTNRIIVCLRIQWALWQWTYLGGWTVLSRLQVLCGGSKSGDEVAGVEFRRAVWGLLQVSFVHWHIGTLATLRPFAL